MYASWSGSAEGLKALLRRGANRYLRNRAGATALDLSQNYFIRRLLTGMESAALYKTLSSSARDLSSMICGCYRSL